MEQQGTHQQRISSVYGANCRLALSRNPGGLCFGQATQPMRCGYHFQGTVLFAAWIKMNANRQHILKNLRWRLHMVDASLY